MASEVVQPRQLPRQERREPPNLKRVVTTKVTLDEAYFCALHTPPQSVGDLRDLMWRTAHPPRSTFCDDADFNSILRNYDLVDPGTGHYRGLAYADHEKALWRECEGHRRAYKGIPDYDALRSFPTTPTQAKAASRHPR